MDMDMALRVETDNCCTVMVMDMAFRVGISYSQRTWIMDMDMDLSARLRKDAATEVGGYNSCGYAI
jgi:cell division inhibitor SulA